MVRNCIRQPLSHRSVSAAPSLPYLVAQLCVLALVLAEPGLVWQRNPIELSPGGAAKSEEEGREMLERQLDEQLEQTPPEDEEPGRQARHPGNDARDGCIARLERRPSMRSLSLILAIGFAAPLVSPASPAHAQAVPEAKDMALLGFNDLQARSAYQPLVREQNGRWITSWS